MQWVFLMLIAVAPTPLRMFSRFVTGSKCHGFTQCRTLHKWSKMRPSGIGPMKALYDRR